ncbi:ctr domain containing protein [Stylonychia lemnae]|uniref:Copper transport protein n=1 Tax=Stylonychia lemnae TaxID=5949 RepID=A0A078AH53_STYLE|nr:ctr domain containing protein [Stylonychia lemnae]|eukprot:CDW80847.1 ctr domain containing protein [Stylonychia lemnae]
MVDYITQFSNYSAQGIIIYGQGDYYFPQELPQMYISSNHKNFFLTEAGTILKTSYYGASIIGMLVLSMFVEFLSFAKWYMITRKRITSTCLNSLVDLNKDKEQLKKEQHKIRLKVIERIIVTILHFLIKALNLLIIIVIMQTFNIGYIIISSVGFGLGHLLFGLIKDSIVIRKVKSERKQINERKQIQMTELLSKRRNTTDTDRF